MSPHYDYQVAGHKIVVFITRLQTQRILSKVDCFSLALQFLKVNCHKIARTLTFKLKQNMTWQHFYKIN